MREPLLDTEWLLGSSPSRGWRRILTQAGLLAALIALAVGFWPSLSKAWLQQQWTQQLHQGESPQVRQNAMIALAELLPDSLNVVMAGLQNPDPEEAKLAFEALDYYIGQMTILSLDQRRGRFAELIHGLEALIPQLADDTKPFAASLAARVRAVQQSDTHPGSLITQRACERILELEHLHAPDATKSMVARVSISDSRSGPSSSPSTLPVVPAATASLSDESTSPPSESNLSMSTIASVDQTRSLSDESHAIASHPSTHSSPGTSNELESLTPSSDGQLRQKLLRANRLVPSSGNLSLSIPPSPDDARQLVPAPTTPPTAILASHSIHSASRVVSPDVEVVGIGRQETEDLLKLLGSVTPRLASAAFRVLENRLNAKELNFAVELAQGTTDQRLLAMERLAKDADINAIPWLAWMGGEADREVRFKAVSLLGSINNDEARRRLRLMQGRERDAEISRQIQSALLASGSTKPTYR